MHVTGAVNLELRLATQADVSAIADLGARAFTDKFAYLYRSDDLARFLREKHSEPHVASEIADPGMRTAVVCEDGRLVGYCKLVLACGWPEHARGKKAIELKQLYTEPGLTGRGLGARLMDWSLAEARDCGADEMQLSVWSGNAGAQRFYTRYGFAKIADIEFWVGAQCDEEFLFAKMLAG